MMDKLAAKVVWSINATRSTVEQARKIWMSPISHGFLPVFFFLSDMHTHRNDRTLGHIVGLLIEHWLSFCRLGLVRGSRPGAIMLRLGIDDAGHDRGSSGGDKTKRPELNRK